jgi:hypothetical protein
LLGIDLDTRNSEDLDKFYISEKNLPHLTELLTKMEGKVNALIDAQNCQGTQLRCGQEYQSGVLSDSRSGKKVGTGQGEVNSSEETLKKLTGIARKCTF